MNPMMDGDNRIGEVLGASIKIQRGIDVIQPEGLCPFGRSGSRDRAKREHTLCALRELERAEGAGERKSGSVSEYTKNYFKEVFP